MCVIFYSTNKEALPTLPQLRRMFKSNSDGASFSFVRNGYWQTMKGFMKMREVEALYPTLEDSDEVIGHFRLATHGKVSRSNCHPFTVVEDKKLSAQCKHAEKGGVLYHNGILRGFGNTKLSDTLHFATSVLAKVNLKERMAILENTEGKFAYITPEGLVELYGDFDQDHFGCYFSNTYWDYGHGKSTVLQTQDDCDNDYLYDDLGYATRWETPRTISDLLNNNVKGSPAVTQLVPVDKPVEN